MEELDDVFRGLQHDVGFAVFDYIIRFNGTHEIDEIIDDALPSKPDIIESELWENIVNDIKFGYRIGLSMTDFDRDEDMCMARVMDVNFHVFHHISLKYMGKLNVCPY